jgi:hypothetical protein
LTLFAEPVGRQRSRGWFSDFENSSMFSFNKKKYFFLLFGKEAGSILKKCLSICVLSTLPIEVLTLYGSHSSRNTALLLGGFSPQCDFPGINRFREILAEPGCEGPVVEYSPLRGRPELDRANVFKAILCFRMSVFKA